MKRKEDVRTAAGMSLPVVVFVVFLTLRLSGTIGWSWWWVTSPLWIPVGLTLALTLIAITVLFFRKRRRRHK